VQRVTIIELFFDLVYLFASPQLSHYLIGHSTVSGGDPSPKRPAALTKLIAIFFD
jgi:low temperature requirement protein LtrA